MSDLTGFQAVPGHASSESGEHYGETGPGTTYAASTLCLVRTLHRRRQLRNARQNCDKESQYEVVMPVGQNCVLQRARARLNQGREIAPSVHSDAVARPALSQIGAVPVTAGRYLPEFVSPVGR